MKTVLIIGLLIGANSFAQTAKEYSMYYESGAGTKMDNSSALLASVRGETVYKCQSVEAKISKAGTSIAVHNVKKPKVLKD